MKIFSKVKVTYRKIVEDVHRVLGETAKEDVHFLTVI